MRSERPPTRSVSPPFPVTLRRFLPVNAIRFAVRLAPAALFALFALIEPSSLAAQDPTTADVQRNADFVWTLVAAVLVFLMQAGFALLETGLTRAKNAVNICMKNIMDFSVGSMLFWLVGFGLMFGPGNGWFGTGGFMLSDFAVDGDPWLYMFWMFQTVFAATAATIVSGAMAERTKFGSYLLYTAFLTALVYPVFGSWAWGSLHKGGGWLEGLGFIDFAGSTVVHSVGGWAALAGAIVVGPRLGRYDEEGRPRAMPGHNLVLATMGMFILWFGWFGFNAGSTTAAGTDVALIAVNTNLSAAAGALAAMIVSWVFLKKPDVTMTMNGALAGLVGITAGCANVNPGSSIVIGLVAGALVVFSVLFFDRVRVDDPVGAISVHGVCGAWGTLAAGLFNAGGTSLGIIGTQLVGIVAAFAWSFGTMYVFFRVVRATAGLRVSAEEEISGLDVLEHGNEAYAPDTYGAPAAGLVPAPAASLRTVPLEGATLLLVPLALFALGAAPAVAQDPAAAPADGPALTANVGWVSEYLYRGVPQRTSSASAGLDLEAGPAYLGTWVADVGDGSEVDLYGGLAFEAGPLEMSLGGTGYLYTGGFDDPYVEGNVGLAWGPLSAEVAIGSYRTDPQALDYAFWKLTAAHRGLHVAGGTFGGDLGGRYAEAGYAFEVSGVDLSVTWVLSDAELALLPSGTSDATLVLGASRTFRIR